MKTIFRRIAEVFEQYNRAEVNDPIVKRGEKTKMSRIFSNSVLEGIFRSIIGRNN